MAFLGQGFIYTNMQTPGKRSKNMVAKEIFSQKYDPLKKGVPLLLLFFESIVHLWVSVNFQTYVVLVIYI